MSKFSLFTVTIQHQPSVVKDVSSAHKKMRPVPNSDVSLSTISQKEAPSCQDTSVLSDGGSAPERGDTVVLSNEQSVVSIAGNEMGQKDGISDEKEIAATLNDVTADSSTNSPPEGETTFSEPSINEASSNAMVVVEEEENYLKTHSKETLLEGILKKYKIQNSTWIKSCDGVTFLVTFVVESGRKEEDVLDALIACGIGKETGTTVGISPLTVCLGMEAKKTRVESKPAGKVEVSPSSEKLKEQDGRTMNPVESASTLPTSGSFISAKVGFEPGIVTAADTETLLPPSEMEVVEGNTDVEQEEGSDFMKSIKARIIIQPVIASLHKNAEFTFDYLIFIILASVISAVGLIENNSVVLVASMLISPLMGPILAATFGAAVNDRGLQNVGIKSELIGLAICILTGFLIGIPVVCMMTSEGPVMPSTDSWPSPEMYGRGLPRSLITGALIALVSGMAVALSVLGENQGSLVGVAISASLLPPAVNAGLLWAYSLRAAIVIPQVILPSALSQSLNSSDTNITAQEQLMAPDSMRCPDLINNSYNPYFTCNIAQETFYLGLISLILTIVNILMIVAAAMLCLKVKQVSPRASVQGEKSFWTEHMKVAKDYNTTVRPDTDIWKTLIHELKTEIGLSDTQVERIDESGQESYKKRLELIDCMLNGSTGNVREFKRTASLPGPQAEKQNRLLRLFSHQTQLESKEYNGIKKSGRFKIVRKKSLQA